MKKTWSLFHEPLLAVEYRALKMQCIQEKVNTMVTDQLVILQGKENGVFLKTKPFFFAAP